MKLLSNSLKIAMIAALALTAAAVQTTPSYAAGTASGRCDGMANITAIRPAGLVALPQADASGYSAWTTDYFTVQLDSRSRFHFQCTSLPQTSGLGSPPLDVTTIAVVCADHSNVVKARHAPHRIEFQCIAHDHRH